MKTYKEKLKDPRWQKMRLSVLERDNFTCQRCFDEENTLHVHHKTYKKGNEPWEYELDNFTTLCADCHEYETDHRYDAEKSLLNSFKQCGFLTDNIVEIAFAVSQLKLRHAPEVVATAYSYAFKSEKIQDELLGIILSPKDKEVK